MNKIPAALMQVITSVVAGACYALGAWIVFTLIGVPS